MCHVSTEKGTILPGTLGARAMEERTLVHKTLGAANSRDSLAAAHRLLQLMDKPLRFHKPPEKRPKDTHLWGAIPFSRKNNHHFLGFSKRVSDSPRIDKGPVP